MMSALIGCSSGNDKAAPGFEETSPGVGSSSSSSSSSSGSLSPPPTSVAWAETAIHSQVVQGICVACHIQGGIAGSTALRFTRGSTSTAEELNLGALDAYVLSMDGQWVLDKVRGLNGHGGGQQIASGSEVYKLLVDYLERLTGDAYNYDGSPKAAYSIEGPSVTYRRASLLLTGSIPSAAKLRALAGANDALLKNEILDLMQGEGFHEFLKRGANDQLLVRSLLSTRSLIADFQYYYPVFRENYRLDTTVDVSYAKAVMAELAEAPLELIAHVVENDRPYTEILTANYTMVSSKTADVYKTGLTPTEEEFVPAINNGQHVSGGGHRFPSMDWSSSRQITIPHAGVLTEPAFLQQYPTTATNRNRARSRWTYMHFLGLDIEGSAARTISASALEDIDNPTLNNEACTVCHLTLDPVAGAFQNFSERGMFRSSAYGMDSLNATYKRSPLYTSGDTWFSDMLAPGFKDTLISDRDASLQELARRIAADPRFAQAAVKFWWPAIFGEPMLGDALSTTQYDAKLEALSQLSQAFASNNHNLRLLLADMIMSDWFRAGLLTEEASADADMPLYTGGRRLLTPEELASKTASITGINDSRMVDDLSIMYGGIDSFNAEKRLRELSHMMLRAAERHALANACTIIASEFNRDSAQRKLFTLVERKDMPGPAYDANLVFPSTESTLVSHAIDIKYVEGQVIHYSATVLNHAHDGYTPNDVTIHNVEVIKPDGSVLISGDTRELYDQYDWITGNPLGSDTSPFRVRKGYSLNLNIPVTMSGEYRINLTTQAYTAGNHLDVSLTPNLFFADANDSATTKIRQQIAMLVERMHGEDLSHSAPKILAYTQLFLDLRANKLRRGASQTFVESDIRCNYDSGGVDRRVWAADPNHTLTAWRGIIATLMTDFDYIFE